ncbi:MAG: hypothetical protein BIFFINMI_00952 [Phycisphaerae bacterium]|nr:hypothetical protein [Phycisphaerae bacterium]
MRLFDPDETYLINVAIMVRFKAGGETRSVMVCRWRPDGNMLDLLNDEAKAALQAVCDQAKPRKE